MNEVFADSFYWLAVLNVEDSHYEAATSYRIEGRIVTSVAVEIEVMDALAGHPVVRSKAVDFWNWLAAEPSITVIAFDDALLQGAFALYRRRLDKQWSFTDCISFEIMRRRRIHLALTADHHFRQAGFDIAF